MRFAQRRSSSLEPFAVISAVKMRRALGNAAMFAIEENDAERIQSGFLSRGPSARRGMLTIAAQTFLGSRGGIARVCQLTARVAIEAGYPVSLLSVQDEGGRYQQCNFWQGCAGSRPKFVVACARAALRGDHILYDQLGTARAHT